MKARTAETPELQDGYLVSSGARPGSSECLQFVIVGNRQAKTRPLNYGLLTFLRLGASHLESAAGLLPINFPQDDWLLAILNGDWVAWMQFIAAACSLCSRIADENLSALGI